MDPAFLQQRIDAAKAQIAAYETAITAITVDNAASYTIDTGQTRQTVTKLDLVAMNNAIDSLMNRIATWEARLNGDGVSIVRPLF